MNINELKKKKLKKVRVLYTDVDGTLVNEDCLFRNQQGYTLNNARAVYDLLKAEVDVVMVSSRTKQQLGEIARLLGFKNYIGDLGGAIVYENGERILKNFGVNARSDKELREWIEERGVVGALFERYKEKVRHYRPWSNKVKSHPLLVGQLDFSGARRWIKENFPQLRIVDNGPVPKERDFRKPHVYHLLPKNMGKQSAIRKDKKERHLKKENLVALGNSREDLRMAKEVGVYFSLDEKIETNEENVIHLRNESGEGFSQVVKILRDNELI